MMLSKGTNKCEVIHLFTKLRKKYYIDKKNVHWPY